MEIWPRCEACGSLSEAAAAIGLGRGVGVCNGVNEEPAHCVTRFVVRLRANRANRCELGRCRGRAGKNSEYWDADRSAVTAS